MPECQICFRHCKLSEGQTGFCGARICKQGAIIAKNYGRLTSVALDPIEKKPLSRFFPGSMILSVGSFGCNLRCPFCQNHEISWSQQAMSFAQKLHTTSPEQLVAAAQKYRSHGNIGIAFTYNEPLISFEFVRDTAILSKKEGLKNVLVTNGTADLSVLSSLCGCIDAMNIDLKCFDEQTYKHTLGGDLEMVKRFISQAVKLCHVELTTLIVPGISDNEQQFRQLVSWISELTGANGENIGGQTVLHITRYFPHFKMTNTPATDISLIHHFADIAKQKLKYVCIGNC